MRVTPGGVQLVVSPAVGQRQRRRRSTLRETRPRTQRSRPGAAARRASSPVHPASRCRRIRPPRAPHRRSPLLPSCIIVSKSELFETIVQLPFPGLVEHLGRQIHPDQSSRKGAIAAPDRPGAATQVEDGPLLPCSGIVEKGRSSVRESFRNLVAQDLDQVRCRISARIRRIISRRTRSGARSESLPDSAFIEMLHGAIRDRAARTCSVARDGFLRFAPRPSRAFPRN